MATKTDPAMYPVVQDVVALGHRYLKAAGDGAKRRALKRQMAASIDTMTAKAHDAAVSALSALGIDVER